MSTTTDTFSWSYSKLRNFETCARRSLHYDILKDVKEPESEALRTGHALHTAFEHRVKSGTPLPLGMGMHEGLLAKLAGAPGKVHAEQKLAITAEFKPVAFFGKGAWFRTVIDYAAVRDDGSATVVDYKTGKPAEDLTQLALMSATLFHHDKRIHRVKAALLFVAYDQVERAEYVREDLTEIWGTLLPRVRKLVEAKQTSTYPPKPSGLCKRFCHVMSCPFQGK